MRTLQGNLVFEGDATFERNEARVADDEDYNVGKGGSISNAAPGVITFKGKLTIEDGQAEVRLWEGCHLKTGSGGWGVGGWGKQRLLRIQMMCAHCPFQVAVGGALPDARGILSPSSWRETTYTFWIGVADDVYISRTRYTKYPLGVL